MYNVEIILSDLKNELNFNRFIHSIAVSTTAKNLAKFYNINSNEAFIAGLLHDYAKNINEKKLYDLSKQFNINYKNYKFDEIKNILHAHVGAYLVKEKYNVNEKIFKAIYTHTTAEKNMTNLQKIIYISDYIEPFRDNIKNQDYFIKLAYTNLDKCIYQILKSTISYLKKRKIKIYYKTIEAYEFYKKIVKGSENEN